jgi:hypothetical protein
MSLAERVRAHVDKVQHLAAGTAATFVVGQLHPVLGALACLLVAWFKEERDRRHPDRHTRDGWDAYATMAGVVPGQLLLEVFGLQLLRQALA